MLQFPYLPKLLKRLPPPNLPSGTMLRWRPMLTVTLVGPGDRRYTTRAVLDTGSDECLFPDTFLQLIGVTPRPELGHSITWRGNRYALRYGDISLMLADDASTYRWPATVAFAPARIPYPLLGLAGCLQFFDVRFRGADRTVELVSNWTYPGATSLNPK